MDKINLKWAKSENRDEFNFGDDLGPYIVSKLSGKPIRYLYYANSRIKISKVFLYRLIKFEFTKLHFFEYLYSLFMKSYLITVGSILQYYSSKRAIVWGSGIISCKDNICASSKYYAVRGKYTLKKLKEHGFKGSVALGDPALLLPIIYKPKPIKKYKLGVIPHITHYEMISQKFDNNQVLIINLNSSNIERIVDEINSCDYIISTSLHGIIVSHAYNIKALWVKLTDKKLGGDNVKFLDYFSSVNIPEYEPFIFSNLTNLDEIISLVEHSEFSLPKVDLSIIQNDLINCAPFHVKECYRT